MKQHGAQYQFSNIAKENNFPEIVTIQNEYSLMCRHFDLDLAEVCHHEKIGLLSFLTFSLWYSLWKIFK